MRHFCGKTDLHKRKLRNNLITPILLFIFLTIRINVFETINNSVTVNLLYF